MPIFPVPLTDLFQTTHFSFSLLLFLFFSSGLFWLKVSSSLLSTIFFSGRAMTSPWTLCALFQLQYQFSECIGDIIPLEYHQRNLVIPGLQCIFMLSWGRSLFMVMFMFIFIKVTKKVIKTVKKINKNKFMCKLMWMFWRMLSANQGQPQFKTPKSKHLQYKTQNHLYNLLISWPALFYFLF